MSNINQENQEFCSKIEQVIFKLPGNRGISKTFQPGNLYKAANNILLTEKTKKSYILTGFCCMNNTCETDGPLSSAILCKILKELNYDSSILCDTPSEKVVKASAELYKLPVTVKDSSDKVLEEDKNIGFMVSIERPGRSEKTNDYRTCKARDISNVTSSLDLLFPNIKDNKKVDYLTISVGDGGNEVGTGNIIEYANYKIVYKKYASLYLIMGIDSDENELSMLELIHLFVELLDKYFGSVCELDIVYNFYKVYAILDEFIIGGEICETSRLNILMKQKELESLE